MDYRKLKKPTHLKEDVWHQHLDWMDVTGRQLELNYARHKARVTASATAIADSEPGRRRSGGRPVTRSLFSNTRH